MKANPALPDVNGTRRHDSDRALLVIRTAPIVSGRTLLASGLLFGWIPVICVREAFQPGQPIDEIIQLVSVAAMAVFLLGWLAYSWLVYDRYGESICLLLSLPGPAGGVFAAEIECNLPLDSGEPVLVRMREQTPRGKRVESHWRIEQRVEPDELRQGQGGRVVVPVRLEIPGAAPGQLLRPSRTVFAPHWVLEISRKRAGIDFHAQFVVPLPD